MIRTLIEINVLAAQSLGPLVSTEEDEELWHAAFRAHNVDSLSATKDLLEYTPYAVLLAPSLQSGLQLTQAWMNVQKANSEITSILYDPSPIASPNDNITPLRRRIRTYITSSLLGLPESSKPHLEAILGYTFSTTSFPSPIDTRNPHIQRTRDIMGPAFADSIDACRPFWGKNLPVGEFFHLVHVYEAFGNNSMQWTESLRLLEAMVERNQREGSRVGYLSGGGSEAWER